VSTKIVEMTPEQCKAARAIVGFDQISLAKAAGLGLSTIGDFERSRRVVPEPTVEAIHRALEKAGIEFIPEDDGGPGVRLKLPKPRKKKSK
jgi:transcriptional regulator with XRE-family HTH domain